MQIILFNFIAVRTYIDRPVDDRVQIRGWSAFVLLRFGNPAEKKREALTGCLQNGQNSLN